MANYQPPRWLESLAGRLVPPAAAEHALGDLAECSRSNARYAANLASILPRVVWSQVVRRFTIGGVCFNAVLTGIVLVVSQGFPRSPFFDEPLAVLRLGIPWAIWVTGTALAAAYGPRDRPQQWSSRLYAATFVVAVGAAALAGVPVLFVIAGLALVVAITLVLTMPWLQKGAPTGALSLATLPDHARLFQRTIRWRNARESLAVGVVVVLNAADLVQTANPVERAGHTLLIAGMLFIAGYLCLRAGARKLPPHADTVTLLRFHRRELARQRDILRAVSVWYLLPFVPGVVVLAIGKSPNLLAATALLAAMGGVFALIRWINIWAATLIDKQLAGADALEEQA